MCCGVGVSVFGVGPSPHRHEILAGTDDGGKEGRLFDLRSVAGGLIDHKPVEFGDVKTAVMLGVGCVPACIDVHDECPLPDWGVMGCV